MDLEKLKEAKILEENNNILTGVLDAINDGRVVIYVHKPNHSDISEYQLAKVIPEYFPTISQVTTTLLTSALTKDIEKNRQKLQDL